MTAVFAPPITTGPAGPAGPTGPQGPKGDTGAQGPGVTANAADASDLGLLSWAYDIVATSTTVTPTAGVVYFTKNTVRAPITVAQAVLLLATGGSGATPLANVYAGIYDDAGVLRGKSADASALFATNASKYVPITAEPGQSLAFSPADAYFYVALLIGQQATTAAQVRGSNAQAGMANLGLTISSTPRGRFLQRTGTVTALPSTVTWATQTTLSGNTIWMGTA